MDRGPNSPRIRSSRIARPAASVSSSSSSSTTSSSSSASAQRPSVLSARRYLPRLSLPLPLSRRNSSGSDLSYNSRSSARATVGSNAASTSASPSTSSSSRRSSPPKTLVIARPSSKVEITVPRHRSSSSSVASSKPSTPRPRVHFSTCPQIAYPPTNSPDASDSDSHSSSAAASAPSQSPSVSPSVSPAASPKFLEFPEKRQTVVRFAEPDPADSVAGSRVDEPLSSSEPDDGFSCLSASTQATSVDQEDSCFDHQEYAPAMTIIPRPFRRRSFSEADQLMRADNKIHISPRRTSSQSPIRRPTFRESMRGGYRQPYELIQYQQQQRPPPRPFDNDNCIRQYTDVRHELRVELAEARNTIHTLEQQYGALTAELKDAVDKIVATQEERDALARERVTCLQELSALRTENTTLKDDGTAVRQQNAYLQEELATAKHDVACLGGENAALRQDVSVLHEENAALQQENGILRQDNTGLKQDNVALQQENSSLRQDNSGLKQDNVSLKQDNVSLKQDNVSLKQDNGSLKQDMTSLKQENGSLREDRAVLRDEIADHLKEIEQLHEKNQALARDHDGALHEIQALQDEKKIMERDLGHSLQDVEALQEETRLLQHDLEAVRRENKELQKDVDDVEHDVKALEKKGAGYRKEIEALEKETQALDDERARFLQDVRVLQADKDVVLQQNAGYMRQIQALQAEKDAVLMQNAGYLHQIQSLLDGQRALEQRHTVFLADVDALQQERCVLQEQLASSRTAEEALQGDIQSYCAHADRLQGELDETKDQLSREACDRTALQAAKDGSETRCCDLEAQVTSVKESGKQLQALLLSQIADLESTRDAVQSRIDSLEKKLGEKEEEIKGLAATGDDLRQSVAHRDEEMASLREERTRQYERELELVTFVTMLEQAKSELGARVEALEAENRALTGAVESLTSDKFMLQEQRTAAERQIHTLEAEAQTRQNEIEVLTRAHSLLRETSRGLQARVSDKEREVQECREAVRQETDASLHVLHKTVNQLGEERTMLRAEVDRLKDRLAAGGGQTGSSLSELKLQQQIAELQGQLAALETGRQELLDERTLLQQSANRSTARIAELQDEVRTLEPFQLQYNLLMGQLAATNAQLAEVNAAHAVARDEIALLQLQLAKQRARGASDSSSTGGKKRSKMSKDHLIVVRSPADRGRFQVMRKSEFYNVRSRSRCSNKSDEDV